MCGTGCYHSKVVAIPFYYAKYNLAVASLQHALVEHRWYYIPVNNDLPIHPKRLLLRSAGKYIKAIPAEMEQHAEHLFR